MSDPGARRFYFLDFLFYNKNRKTSFRIRTIPSRGGSLACMLSSIAELRPLLPCGPVGTYIWCGLEQTSVEQPLIATASALVVPKSISALDPLLQASFGPRCSSMSHTLHSPREICLFWQPPRHSNIQVIPGTSWQLLVGTAATLIRGM